MIWWTLLFPIFYYVYIIYPNILFYLDFDSLLQYEDVTIGLQLFKIARQLNSSSAVIINTW